MAALSRTCLSKFTSGDLSYLLWKRYIDTADKFGDNFPGERSRLKCMAHNSPLFHARFSTSFRFG